MALLPLSIAIHRHAYHFSSFQGLSRAYFLGGSGMCGCVWVRCLPFLHLLPLLPALFPQLNCMLLQIDPLCPGNFPKKKKAVCFFFFLRGFFFYMPRNNSFFAAFCAAEQQQASTAKRRKTDPLSLTHIHRFLSSLQPIPFYHISIQHFASRSRLGLCSHPYAPPFH